MRYLTENLHVLGKAAAQHTNLVLALKMHSSLFATKTEASKLDRAESLAKSLCKIESHERG